jgi:hypothetical protein
MSWTRGRGTTDFELSRVQSWIEDKADPDLYGKNGDPGMVRGYREDKAKREQRDEDKHEVAQLVRWLIGPGVIVLISMSIARAVHLIN